MIGKIETVGTQIEIETIDGNVTVTIETVDPDSRQRVGISTLSCLTRVKALQLAQLLTAAAKGIDQEEKVA